MKKPPYPSEFIPAPRLNDSGVQEQKEQSSNSIEPSYKEWVERDDWSYFEAACLLKGLNPTQADEKSWKFPYGFNYIEEFVKTTCSWSNYRRLKVFAWLNRATLENVVIPEKLLDVIKTKFSNYCDEYPEITTRYPSLAKKLGFALPVIASSTPAKNIEEIKPNPMSTELENTTKKTGGKIRKCTNLEFAVGVMALLLAEKVTLYKRGINPNATQIANAVQDLAQNLKIADDAEMKSFNKTISEAVKKISSLMNP